MEIVVVANRHRKPLVEKHLLGFKHIISYTKDYNLPADFKPETIKYVYNHTGAYRCFKGHQDAIRFCREENVLVLEDDAVPKIKDWYNIVMDSVHLLNSFEIVSLHGRNRQEELYKIYEEIRPGNNFLYIPKKKGPTWVQGSLAYLINKRSFGKLLGYVYNGTPVDILLVNYFSFCLIEKSPFKHDRSQGTLIE